MAQVMNDAQRLAILEAYEPKEHLISVGTNKDKTPVLYYPAAWRLYELRLRHPNFTLEAEIIHMDVESGMVIVKAIGYDGLDYASSNLKGTAMKQGKLLELDKVETKAKSRVARDIGIGTEYALDMDADEEERPQSSQNGQQPVSSSAQQNGAVKQGKTATASAHPQNEGLKTKLDELYTSANARKIIEGLQGWEMIKAEALGGVMPDEKIEASHYETLRQYIVKKARQASAGK